jgi:uncharacterized protein (DUF885 family)
VTRDAAAAALVSFGDALAGLQERATAGFAIGRELFDRKLHTWHMIRENADELLRYGERLRDHALWLLQSVAAEIDADATWPEIADRLRADTPAPSTALGEYDAAVRSARAFVEERELVRVPDAPLAVVPTPEFLRALVPFAAYQGPGAFDEEQEGRFFVTLPGPEDPWCQRARAELPSTALHEAIPGHHLQIVTANALERPLRRVVATPAAREGWALYCETLMAEQGFLATRESRFFQAHHLLWRALRVTLDVSLHTLGMSRATASRILRETLGFDEASAESEVRRYCAYPTYQLCYAVGRRDILQLRDDARAARGESFSLAGFHQELLSYGAYPTVLARWGMGLG